MSRLTEAPDEVDDVIAHVTEVICQELAVPHCGPDETLVMAGADSLVVIRVWARLQDRYGDTMPLAEMLRLGSPRAVAERIRQTAGSVDGPAAATGPGPGPRPDGGWEPLSFSQLPFFRMDRAAGGVGLFNAVLRLRLVGDVDAAALRDAVGDLVRRQSVLRTLHREGPDGPVQRELDQEPALPALDLRGERAEARLRKLLRRETLTGFDLEAGPAARFVLVRTAERDWSLVVTLHHLIMDGWTQSLLPAEVAEAYRRRVEGLPPRPAPPARYVDFARWQHEHLTGSRLDAHLEHVERVLAGPASALSGSSGSGSFRSFTEAFPLPEAVGPAVQRVAAGRGITPFTTLAAALLDFAHRRTGVPVQVLSSHGANRSWPGAEQLMGCFANVLHVRAEFSPGTGPDDVLHQVNEAVLDAVSHEELPLEIALETLSQRGREAGHRLPDLAFLLQPQWSPRVELPGCVLTCERPPPARESVDPTRFGLVLEVDWGSQQVLAHRLADRWPDGEYEQARSQLLAGLERFCTEVAGTTPTTDPMRGR